VRAPTPKDARCTAAHAPQDYAEPAHMPDREPSLLEAANGRDSMRRGMSSAVRAERCRSNLLVFDPPSMLTSLPALVLRRLDVRNPSQTMTMRHWANAGTRLKELTVASMRFVEGQAPVKLVTRTMVTSSETKRAASIDRLASGPARTVPRVPEERVCRVASTLLVTPRCEKEK
jgi:hypothetical protein